LSKDPVWLTERLVFLGEIERKNDFEARSPIGKIVQDGLEEDDYLMDDSALAYKSPRGLVIVTGCSHAGICNIVEQAKRICREDRVVDIVGGFHLLDPSEEQLQGTLAYMERLQPTEVHACHCTDLSSKIALSRVVNLKEVGVGSVFEYE
jgi:7,8-dihydropterin-6-yl-methyl-4-(beta-D-ribofuranosyl)aminobenzene 5'-phosphate synthase